MKLDYGVGKDLQEDYQENFLSTFKKIYERTMSEKIARQDKNDDELHQFPYPFPNQMRVFEEDTGVDVQELLENASLEDPDRPSSNPRVDAGDKEWI